MILSKKVWALGFSASERVRAGRWAGVGCLGSAVASRGWGLAGVVIEEAGGAAGASSRDWIGPVVAQIRHKGGLSPMIPA